MNFLLRKDGGGGDSYFGFLFGAHFADHVHVVLFDLAPIAQLDFALLQQMGGVTRRTAEPNQFGQSNSERHLWLPHGVARQCRRIEEPTADAAAQSCDLNVDSNNSNKDYITRKNGQKSQRTSRKLLLNEKHYKLNTIIVNQ